MWKFWIWGLIAWEKLYLMSLLLAEMINASIFWKSLNYQQMHKIEGIVDEGKH